MKKTLSKQLARCAWVTADPLYITYHDEEWGLPVYDEKVLFEFLILEGMQAGLSWITVLRKREHYRELLDNFDAKKIARYTDKKIQALLSNPNIIRNKLKVNGIVKNAQAYLALKKEVGSFSDYLWQFVNGNPIQNQWETIKSVPATSPESAAMSKALKKQGFTFVGSTICYAFMQAVGMINDHTLDCHRHKICAKHKLK